ncbi:MAG: hypothetical protein RIS85_2809 [Pseudomonadota bacterium]|jgi:hypothetical protein
MPTDVCVQHQNSEWQGPVSAQNRSTLRDLMPAAALLFIGLAGLVAASLSGTGAGTGASGQYLVVAAPWSSQSQTINMIASADGGLAAAARFSNIAIAYSSHPDFADRAKNAGFWLAVPSPQIAGCFGTRTEVPRK